MPCQSIPLPLPHRKITTKIKIEGENGTKIKTPKKSSPPKPKTNPEGANQKFSATVTCKFCKKKGHSESTCWYKFPEKRPSFKKAKEGGGQQGGHKGQNEPKPKPQAENTPKFEPEINQTGKRQRINVLNPKKLWTLKAFVNQKQVTALIESGASISVVSNRLVPEANLNREKSIPVQVANGQTCFTLGETELILRLELNDFSQKAHVLETDAFEAILGLDFLTENPRCRGILTYPSPARLIFDGEEIILSNFLGVNAKPSCFHVHRAFKTEAYTLIPEVKVSALQNLCLENDFLVDLFANHLNAQHKLFCTRQNSAFRYNWSSLCQGGNSILWANPPFSQLDRVLAKVVLSPCKIVLVTPNWPGRPWRSLLDKLAVAQFHVPPGTPLYQTDRDHKVLPSPLWETTVSFLNTLSFNVRETELDPSVKMWVEKKIKLEFFRSRVSGAEIPFENGFLGRKGNQNFIS